MRVIVVDIIKCCCIMVNTLRFVGSHFTLSLITTPTEQLSVSVPLASKRKLYVVAWINGPQSVCKNSFRFMTNECINNITTGERADIGTAVVIEGNTMQLGSRIESCSV